MPYYLHCKSQEPERGSSYPTASDAHAANSSPSTHKVSFIPDETDRTVWRQREQDRFDAGVYLDVPWKLAPSNVYPDHYVHLSVHHPGLIAYTKTEEHGHSDRQTRVRPGKYLGEFYADVDGDTRQLWIAQCSAQHTSLSIARTPADIARVYRGGPSSCMDGKKRFLCHPMHPCEVYGNSDLAVAYIGEIDKARARSVVWPDKTLHSRIYGAEDVLRQVLESAGYTYGSMSGARIRAVEHNDGYVMPYVDGISEAEHSRCGSWLMLGSGDIDAQRINGVTEEEDNRRTCDNCGDSYEDDEDHNPYCQSCYDDSFNCIDCNNTYFSDGTSVDDGMLCEHCAREREKTCAVEDCDNRWLEETEFGSQNRRIRRNNGTDVLCRSCWNHHEFCNDCDTWYCTDDHSACPDCEPEEDAPTPRCDKTDDLPFAATPDVPTVRYMRNTRMEFDGFVAYLMIDTANLVLKRINKNGTVEDVVGNWTNDYRLYVTCGNWEYFTPVDSQLPRPENAPIRAHLVTPASTLQGAA